MRRILPIESRTPEDFAARDSHGIVICSYLGYRFRDPEVDAWVGRLHDILTETNGAPSVRHLRETLLTDAERAPIAEAIWRDRIAMESDLLVQAGWTLLPKALSPLAQAGVILFGARDEARAVVYIAFEEASPRQFLAAIAASDQPAGTLLGRGFGLGVLVRDDPQATAALATALLMEDLIPLEEALQADPQ